MKKPTKKHLKTLEKRLYELDLNEARLQFGYGDCPKGGSVRACEKREADALRAVLAWVKGVMAVAA